MIKYSFRLPNADYLGFPATTKAIVETACKAEELGFDALFVNDHVIVDDSPRSTPWRNVYDPLMVLSYVAARTSTVKLGTSVLIMPYRNPIVTAKMFATLDQMSEGRAIAGIGAGWSEAEYDALGRALPAARGAHQRIPAPVESVLGAGPHHLPRSVLFFRQHARQPQAGAATAPADMDWRLQPCVAAPRRPVRPSLAAHAYSTGGLDKQPAYLRDVCAEIEREDVPRTRMSFRVNFSSITGSSSGGGDRPTGQGSPEQVASDMNRYRQEAGLEEFQINFNGCGSLQQLLDSMDLLVQEVIPKVDS